MTRTVDRSEIVTMLRQAAASEGLDFERFVELGRSGRLDNPALRDLWIIWGDLIQSPDDHAAA